MQHAWIGKLGAFVLLWSTTAFASPSVTITGNKRTDAAYIKKLFLDCLISQESSDAPSLTALRQCMLNSKLFSDVSLEKINNHWRLNVEERWTLIVAPYFESGSEGSTAFGLIGVESNFLGNGKFLLLSSTFRSGGSNLVMLYRDPNIRYTRWRSSLDLEQRRNLLTLKNGQIDADVMSEEKRRFGVGTGYAFLANQLVFTTSAVVQQHKFKRVKDWHMPRNYYRYLIEINGRWDQSNFRLYYQEGLSVSSQLVFDLARSDKATPVIGGTLTWDWQYSPWLNHAVQIKLNLASIKAPVKSDAIRIGKKPGARGMLIDAAWTEKYMTTALDYQVPVKQLDVGTITIAPFVDFGRLVYFDRAIPQTDYHAFGIGSYLYLKQVAVPGMGLQVGSNSRFQRTYISFSIGSSI